MKIKVFMLAVRVGFEPVRPLWDPQATDSSLPRALRLPPLPPLLGPYCPIHCWSDRQLASIYFRREPPSDIHRWAAREEKIVGFRRFLAAGVGFRVSRGQTGIRNLRGQLSL
jgi:hypothetical protein